MARLLPPQFLQPPAAILTLLAFLVCVPSGFGQGPTSKQQPNRASKPSSIKGRVVDSEGRPLPGASVILMPAGANPDSGNERQTVRTDQDGRFAFDAVADRPYTVRVFGFEPPDAAQYHLPGETITIRVEKGGVITGRVTSIDGQPLVGIQVLAKCIGAKGGEPFTSSSFSYELSRSRITDDRGIYRFWSLQPGVYIVSAGPAAFGFNSGLVTPYNDDSPTYYPSSTFGSAAHLELNSGQELTGIDITYRGYTGHAVSGTMTGNSPPSYLQAYLATLSGDYVDSVSLPAAQSSGPFAFGRVSDGEYLLVAVRNSTNEIVAISPPRAVTVKGADVAGFDLKPMALGSLAGHLKLENDPKLECKNKTTNALAETLLSLKRAAPPKENYPSFIESQLANAASPDSAGQFAIKRVPAGNYRIATWLPNEDWYVGTITLGSGAQQVDVASRGFSISQGQTISSLNVVIKNGAAGLAGRVVPAAAGTSLPVGLRVYLLHTEPPNRSAEPLRFYETEAGSDGSFKFKNLAPGSYRITVHMANERDSTQSAAGAAAARARLSQEATGKTPLIELHPCQRQTDFILKYR